jgi:hypothetical protein
MVDQVYLTGFEETAMSAEHGMLAAALASIGCVAVAGLVACGGGGDPSLASGTERTASAKGGPARLVQRIVTDGKTAYALYFQSTNDYCQSLSVETFASLEETRTAGTGGPRSVVPHISVQLVCVNFSLGEEVFMSGQADAPIVSINDQLTEASARATVVLTDGMRDKGSVSLDMRWSGGVLIFDDKTFSIDTTPYSKTIIKTSGATRSSDSVTGSIVLNGVDLLSPANVTDLSFILGRVSGSGGSTIDIVRTR